MTLSFVAAPLCTPTLGEILSANPKIRTLAYVRGLCSLPGFHHTHGAYRVANVQLAGAASSTTTFPGVTDREVRAPSWVNKHDGVLVSSTSYLETSRRDEDRALFSSCSVGVVISGCIEFILREDSNGG